MAMPLLRTLQRATHTKQMLQPFVLVSRLHSVPVPAPSSATPTNQTSSDITAAPTEHAVTAEVLSGAPVELRNRVVRVYQPTRNTMQSGAGKSKRWRIDFDILQGGGRWENPLMGWASSADYVQGSRLSFRSKEDAIHFAEKQGWDYYVQPGLVKRVPPKNYAENYVYKPSTLRICRTK